MLVTVPVLVVYPASLVKSDTLVGISLVSALLSNAVYTANALGYCVSVELEFSVVVLFVVIYIELKFLGVVVPLTCVVQP